MWNTKKSATLDCSLDPKLVLLDITLALKLKSIIYIKIDLLDLIDLTASPLIVPYFYHVYFRVWLGKVRVPRGVRASQQGGREYDKNTLK